MFQCPILQIFWSHHSFYLDFILGPSRLVPYSKSSTQGPTLGIRRYLIKMYSRLSITTTNVTIRLIFCLYYLSRFHSFQASLSVSTAAWLDPPLFSSKYSYKLMLYLSRTWIVLRQKARPSSLQFAFSIFKVSAHVRPLLVLKSKSCKPQMAHI